MLKKLKTNVIWMMKNKPRTLIAAMIFIVLIIILFCVYLMPRPVLLSSETISPYLTNELNIQDDNARGYDDSWFIEGFVPVWSYHSEKWKSYEAVIRLEDLEGILRTSKCSKALSPLDDFIRNDDITYEIRIMLDSSENPTIIYMGEGARFWIRHSNGNEYGVNTPTIVYKRITEAMQEIPLH